MAYFFRVAGKKHFFFSFFILDNYFPVVGTEKHLFYCRTIRIPGKVVLRPKLSKKGFLEPTRLRKWFLE